MYTDVVTPITKIEGGRNNIFIKRDDLLPFSFGGNKVRIAAEYVKDMKAKGGNCMIGYGNVRSNLCRVLANTCFKENIPCYIVSPMGSEDHIHTFNSDMVESFGANVVRCERNNVAATIESVMAECVRNGLKPYYINGNKFGKGNETVPVRAYAKCYEEIIKQSNAFDYIFTATGTGMTQAGLISGKLIYGGAANIVGISVARDKEQEENVIKEFVKAYLHKTELSGMEEKEINISDSYICGGYGQYDTEIEETIINMLKKNGIPLDPVYTGKAYHGMKEYIRENNIQNANILFIHTGGLPIFFDNIELLKKNN